jgi:hypothetical protein
VSAHFEALGYADVLPLRFEPLAKFPEGAILAGLNAENLQVLVADASLDEQRPLDVKTDEEHALAEDLQRVEFKLNVLIELVARLLKRADDLPPARGVRLYAGGVEWLAAGAEAPSGIGIVRLHVSRHFPQPLALPGRVVGRHEDAEGSWVQFVFEGLAPKVVALLERLVFRHHRRSVAGSRHPFDP